MFNRNVTRNRAAIEAGKIKKTTNENDEIL